MSAAKVLVVEDDFGTIDVISRAIADLGYETESAVDGMIGLKQALENNYCLVILDLDLPRLGGLEICRRLRETKPSLPILILTGKSDEVSRVLGLELGADDYLCKPFSIAEFRARVRALLRRSSAWEESPTKKNSTEKSGSTENSIIKKRDLVVDFSARQTTLAGQEVILTITEFDILEVLIRNQGRAFTRESLLEAVWGLENQNYEQNVRTHISRLRAKIDCDHDKNPFIVTLRGYGYRFATDEELE